MKTARRAIIMADVMMGLALLAAAGVVLAVALSRQKLAAARLADAREATRVAEIVLTQLQTRSPVPANDPPNRVVIQDGGPGPVPGHHWVDVTVTVQGQSRSLAGLVPVDSDPVRGEPR